MPQASKPANATWLVWPLTVGAAVALSFSNGCGNGNSNGGGSGDDGGGSSGSSSGSSSSGTSGGSSGSSGGSSGGSGGSSGASSSGGSSGGGSGGSSGSSSGGTGTDAGVVGGVPGGVAGPGVTVSGCEIFPADNPWNTLIDGPLVQVIHAYDANIPQGTALHPDFGGWTQGYGIPFSVVPSSQPLQTTNFTVYADQSDPGPMGWIGTNPNTAGIPMGQTMWPFFTGMHIEGNPAAGSLTGDQHGIVLQQGSSGCHLYEAWQCIVVSAPPFSCANGAVFDTTSNSLRPLGWTSADAAGLSIFAGLARLAEVKAGAINHAIRVTFNNVAKAYILPATHAAGSHALPDPPMGLRLRLKASVDISGYHAESKVILTAMQKYGLMVADIGSDWYFQADSDDGWNGTAADGSPHIIDEVIGDFGSIHGSDFEAIDSGPAITTGL